MRVLACKSGWAAAGICGVLLLAGCTDATPTGAPTSADASAASASPVACDNIQVRDIDTVPGEWTLAEAVLIRGVPGTKVTVDLPADAEAAVSVGLAPDSASDAEVTGSTASTGLTIERATVTTQPVSDLEPATLQEAIGPAASGLLSLTNAGQAGFTGQLGAVLAGDGNVVFRGAREVTVTFTGDCSGPSGVQVPVIGTARYFDSDEAGVLDCGKTAKPGTLGEIAAQSCVAE